MKIYVAHSRMFDFSKELYLPIRNSALNAQYEFVLPHEVSDKPFNSWRQMKTFQAVIAEVSFPSTALGVEIGWAYSLGIPILCLSKLESVVSGALRTVATQMVEYKNAAEMITMIEQFVDTVQTGTVSSLKPSI